MLPVNYGGHAAYQDTFVSQFLELFPNPFALPKQTWDIIVKFWYLDLSETDTILCTPSSVGSLQMTLPVSALFTISSTACGSLTKTTASAR